MAPAFHVNVLVHKKCTQAGSLSPGSLKADVRCLVPVSAPRPAATVAAYSNIEKGPYLQCHKLAEAVGVAMNDLGRTLFSLCWSWLASAAVSSVCV